MSKETGPSQLNVIVDLTRRPFDFKTLYAHLSSEPPVNADHHYWHFAGLRSFTIPFQETDDDNTINIVIEKLKLVQNHRSLFPPFWICKKRISPLTPDPLLCEEQQEVINKNVKVGRFATNEHFRIHYTSGALTQLDKYLYNPETEIKDAWCLVFYHDRIDLDYGSKDERKRKTLKADLMDRCTAVMTDANSITLFINMTGNAIDYKTPQTNHDSTSSTTTKSNESTVSYIRTATEESQSFHSTIRLVISISNESNLTEPKQRLHVCHTKFMEFFERNHIHPCTAIIESHVSTRDLPSEMENLINRSNNSFIKQYCWQMLKSIGYRFEKRLSKTFIHQINRIDDDDEFYQTALHIWRRSSEYYFIDLCDELYRYRDKRAALASLSSSLDDTNRSDFDQQRWSIFRPPQHYAYVPSVTLTPTTVCVNPLKLVKTNRVLREKKFGGNFEFALVDVRDENRTLVLFPHDYRVLRWKMERLLEFGFYLGHRDRIFRYLHHSQSQLKDKQFWFYHHEPGRNFSFEEAFKWMGDFQGERIVAKHAARIAQCFTSAEATIPISKDKVKIIDDIRSKDHKYNFTDGVGTMSTLIRDKIDPHRKFSAIQIRYAGCKGVISVDPDLDHSEHELHIRDSMKKFECEHDILELCRISKPRPLYLNRQIIVLLSHRKIDDRRFLLLQNDHEKTLTESLVYPDRAYELLNEKLNRSLFPLRSLIQDAQLNLIQEPFFRQLIVTIGKFELAQMRERSRLKLPKNTARNMIGIVDEYGILKYGQVFVQYTELSDDYSAPTESDKTTILQQKVVVTKNPCYHPGDLRVFTAVDVPRLRHLKDVIVFPQKGDRPHPNEISGSDLDGDEYAVIWHPSFIPQTANDTPYDYDSQIPMLEVKDREVNRADIRNTVLDISEQCCVGKLCSLHLAYMDLYGLAHPKTLGIAGCISEELDAPKTGLHPLTPKEISALQAELDNRRPDYFDKPYYRLYPSKHVLGQLYRSCDRFEPHWSMIQAPPTTLSPYPIDPLLVHNSYRKYMSAATEIARIYRESIMDIMYVYRFSSDIDLLCRFDSSAPQYKAPLCKTQTESACLIADSAQVEYKQLIDRIRKLFSKDLNPSDDCSPNDSYITDEPMMQKKMAKASALYVYCYRDTSHARRILSLPWLFAKLLIETRKMNIKKQSKLLSPSYVAQMLEIQPYRLMGQSLLNAARYLVGTKKSFAFQHTYVPENNSSIEVSCAGKCRAKALVTKQTIPLMKYFVIEILHHFVESSLSDHPSPITESKPALVESVWQHLLTRFVLGKCSPSVLVPSLSSSPPSTLLENDFSFWSDEQAWHEIQSIIQMSVQCSEHASNPSDYAIANEYLILALQKLATTGSLFS